MKNSWPTNKKHHWVLEYVINCYVMALHFYFHFQLGEFQSRLGFRMDMTNGINTLQCIT